jgi:hypothetical protein
MSAILPLRVHHVDVAGAGKYARSLEDLERGVHVPVEDQVTEQHVLDTGVDRLAERRADVSDRRSPEAPGQREGSTGTKHPDLHGPSRVRRPIRVDRSSTRASLLSRY